MIITIDEYNRRVKRFTTLVEKVVKQDNSINEQFWNDLSKLQSSNLDTDQSKIMRNICINDETLTQLEKTSDLIYKHIAKLKIAGISETWDIAIVSSGQYLGIDTAVELERAQREFKDKQSKLKNFPIKSKLITLNTINNTKEIENEFKNRLVFTLMGVKGTDGSPSDVPDAIINSLLNNLNISISPDLLCTQLTLGKDPSLIPQTMLNLPKTSLYNITDLFGNDELSTVSPTLTFLLVTDTISSHYESVYHEILRKYHNDFHKITEEINTKFPNSDTYLKMLLHMSAKLYKTFLGELNGTLGSLLRCIEKYKIISEFSHIECFNRDLLYIINSTYKGNNSDKNLNTAFEMITGYTICAALENNKELEQIASEPDSFNKFLSILLNYRSVSVKPDPKNNNIEKASISEEFNSEIVKLFAEYNIETFSKI
jgi:hypothetical protein